MAAATAQHERLLRPLLAHAFGRALLCVLSGTLLFLACADFDIWPLCWIGLLPLLLVLLDSDGTPRVTRPFLYGWLCGLVANGGGFYWIVGLLMRFGHMPFVAALPIFLLLIAYQCLTFGLFSFILCRLRTHMNVPVTWLAPLVWVACELCVPYVFPWYLAITQAWVPPVIQIADITGPLGVSFLLVLGNGALFDLLCALRGRRPAPQALRTPLLAALTILGCLGYGVVRIAQVRAARDAAPKVRIGVVQANIGIHEKFVPGLREEQAALHQRLSAELERRGAELLVWPESSYPYYFRRPVLGDHPPDSQYAVRRGFTAPLLFGALTVDESGPRPVPYNTALLFDKKGRTAGSFDKNFLLVFGEYIPFAEHMGWLRRLVPEMSNFARGTETTTFPFSHRGTTYQIGPMVCYEDIIPAFGRRLFSGENPPNLLINITNDAWFGSTSEPYEHMALSVYRAVEHRVDLVRAVNTGVSAFIDATGRVYDKGPSVDPQLTPGVPPTVLLNDAALLAPGGLYQRLGETFGGGCLVLVLLLGVLARIRAERPLRLGWLLLGTGGLLAFLLVGGLLLPDADLGAILATLGHRNEGAFSDAVLFTATGHLTLLLSLGAAVLGALFGRRVPAVAQDEGYVQGRLELLCAVISVGVLPVVLLGRMEGNTGGVVLLVLLCCGTALLGRRLGALTARRRRKAAPR